MQKITIELSQKSVENAIKQIEAYRTSLERKIDMFLSRLADTGIEVVRATMGSVPDDDRGNYSVEKVNSSPNGVAILLSGNKILFVEFGAGVIYSNPQHPKAGEMGYGVGTYNPQSGNAWNLTKWGGGWWYTENGNSKHSYGNPAYMPLYKAEIDILEKVGTIAREVFRSS